MGRLRLRGFLERQTHQCLREHPLALQKGQRRTHDADRPKQTPIKVEKLAERIGGAGLGCKAFAQRLIDIRGAIALRALYGMLDLLRRYQAEDVDRACAFAANSGISSLRFVRIYLQHHATALKLKAEHNHSGDPNLCDAFHTADARSNAMTNDEIDRSLRQLRLGGMADAASIRSQQARAENLGPFDFISLLVHDELQRRRDRLIERRVKAAGFRDQRTLDTFDWKFNTLDRALIFGLANGRFIEQHEDVLLLGNAGVGKSHIAQAIGMAAIHAGFRVLYREAHVLFEDLLLANATGERADAIATYSEIPLLIIDDLGMRKLPASAAEDLLEIVMRRYERTSTILTSNRPLDDWPYSSATPRPLRHSSIGSCTIRTSLRFAARATACTSIA